MKPYTLIFSLLLPLGIVAQEAPRDTTSLAELLVTAPYKTNVALTPLDVTVVTSQEIDKSTETSLLPVLMNKIPGFFVSERGLAGYGVSGGAAGTVNIRGVGGGNKVLFMIDGMPQWAGLYGHSLADTYVANGVERVEVVKGPSSLLYGSSAMGGSVNIITRRQYSEGITGRARAMFGSYYTQKFDLSTGFRKGKFSGVLAGQLERSNGNRAGSEFWLANEYIQLQYSASKYWNVGTNVDMTQSTANNPGTIQTPLENMWTNIFRGTASIYANNTYDIVHGGVQAYINWGHHNVDDGNAPGSSPNDYIFHSNDYNMGFSIFETVNPWTGNDLSLGIDFQQWGGRKWNTYKEGGDHFKQAAYHENEIAGYIMMQQSFIHDFLSLNAGVRLQHNSQYGNIWVPQAGFLIKPGNVSEIKFSFSKGFRSPSIGDLYLNPPANSDLKPEYMLNYELSYRCNLIDGKLNMGVAFFFIDGKNMIQREMIDGKPRFMNTDSFKNKGFEIDGTYNINRKWNASVGYAYLHTSNHNLLYAPKNKLDASLTFMPGNFELTLEDSNIWSLKNGNPDGHIDYTLVNFRGAYTYHTRVPVTFFVKVDNIFDQKYEVVYGCPMPGITVMGGVEFKF